MPALGCLVPLLLFAAGGLIGGLVAGTHGGLWGGVIGFVCGCGVLVALLWVFERAKAR
jgi:hypothetical protein